MAQKRRVVIAGAGFAAVKLAKALRGKADVTVVAPTDRFVYLPLIHELISEHESPPSVSKPLRDILPGARLVESRVVAVEDKEAVTAEGDRLPFDVFVSAIGAEPNDFGIPGVREHTFSFYSVRDALLANGHLKAAAAEVYGRRVKVVIVGASFTGVEVAGEVRELMRKLDVACDIVLMDAAPRVFPNQSPEFQSAIHAGMQAMDLEVKLGQRISAVNDGVVIVAPKGKGRRAAEPADVILWCAGAKPRTIEGIDPEVGPTLRSASRGDVFVVGDAARFPPEMGVPRLAQTAEQQAPVAAYNILHINEPDQWREYRPELKGIIVSIGQDQAVAEIGGQVLKGKIPWHIKKRLYKAKIALV